MTAQPATPDGSIVLVPGDRFFLQTVPLEPGATPASQVELALEASSPFPLAQVYHGLVTSAAGTQALAFAAYRRRFTNEEITPWDTAAAVVPSFLALCGTPPSRSQVVVHVQPGLLQGVAWAAGTGVPAAVRTQVVEAATEADVTALSADLRRLANLGEAEVRRLEGPVEAAFDDKGEAVFKIGGKETARFSAVALAQADVRDKAFLDERAAARKGDRRWWFAAAGVAALVLLAFLLELGALGVTIWSRRERQEVAGRADAVRQIENAQTMARRIEQLSARQQRPLEWLAQASAVRPRSIQFVRAISRNERALEIEAQTPNAADVGNFEAALRQMSGLASAEMRDLRAREGMTSFVVALTFQPTAGEGPR